MRGARLVVACALLLPTLAAQAAEMETCPFAAHNAYPYLFFGGDYLPRALRAGLKHIEVDITYDAKRNAAVVTHDHTPRGSEPELDSFLNPLWKQWEASSDDGFTLILDFKSSEPRLAERVHALLRRQESSLSFLPNTPKGRFQERKVTVCLTGSGAGHQSYAKLIPRGGRFLAFGDAGAEDWRADVADYVPKAPARFVRFLTFERRVFMTQADQVRSRDVSLDRLRKVVDLANRGGYRIRIYVLNAKQPLGGVDDSYWKAGVEAGVHMLATDNYEFARDWWLKRQTKS